MAAASAEDSSPIDAIAIINSLKSLNDEKAVASLEKLSVQWAQRFEFAELDVDQKISLADGLCHHMEMSSSDVCKRLSVEMIRLLSRDKTNIERWIDDRLILNLVTFTGIPSTGHVGDIQRRLALEAQKALCNLTFQCEKARRICIGSECLEGVCRRLQLPLEKEMPDYDHRFYDLRLLFLLTALCADVRAKCRDAPLDGLLSLTNILDALLVGNYASETERKEKSVVAKARKVAMSEKEVNLACETLKVAFNLVLPFKLTQMEEGELDRLDHLTDILREGLFVQSDEFVKREELRSNIVNMLAALPSSCYERLTPKVEAGIAADSTHSVVPVYEGRNMQALQILLDFMNNRLDKPAAEQLECLSPVLTLLIDMARKHRHLRKYLRFKILPPLTEVMTRPEEGTTLRNKLVRLMTSVSTEIKDLAADFLFELCNRSIDRLIKYTGFGNAAGMLSTHGLMTAAITGRDDASNEDNENSDTEEYIRVREQINPIIGCYEAPRPDPMAGMSEEQKEYEAMKLVEQIDKLMKQGVVVPGRLGEDGRVHPVDHVLQLAEESESGVMRRRTSSDDEVDD